MKRRKNLYPKIENIDVLFSMYFEEIQKNTKNKEKLEKYEQYLLLNIFQLYDQICQKKVTFDPYIIFMIKEPKKRLIMSQSIKDKLLNHVVARYFLLETLEKSLIDANVATLKGKGTSYGQTLLKKYIHEIKKERKEVYYLKCDITKYFYSIDHDVLKRKLRKKIKDLDALYLLDQIIDSTDHPKHIQRIKAICSKMDDSFLSWIKKGKGIPIGNMTSQIFAIFYLNDFDHYVKETLKSKYYIRYMDDFIFLDTDKEKLKRIYWKVKEILKEEYLLELNPKTHIGTLKNGLDFLGYRFLLKNQKLYLKIRNRVKKNFKKKVKNKKNDPNFSSILSSYRGFFLRGNGYYLYRKVLLQNQIKKDIINM